MAQSKKGRGDADFSAPVKRLLAERAAFRCSMPRCDKTTIGPAVSVQKSSCFGRAAHIYSASDNGPRGTGGLDKKERALPENGIWLCNDHADLVDKHRGRDYPPSLLHRYKEQHESKIARELGGIYNPAGWVERVTIESSPIFSSKNKIELSKMNLLIGDNGTGKSAICEWVSSVKSFDYLDRWRNRYSGRDGLKLSLSYVDPDPQEISIDFSTTGYPVYFNGKTECAVPTSSVQVVFPGEIRFQENGEDLDDLRILANCLRIPQLEILALTELVGNSGTSHVTKAWFQEDESGNSLYANVRGTHDGLSFRGLSGSEQKRVIMEFAILAADNLASFYPTLLILDSVFGGLDEEWLKLYGEALVSSERRFQTIASIPSQDIALQDLEWVGWKVTALTGQPPNVVINTQ